VKLRLALSYDGTGFHGWAEQPGLRTVEGVLAAALDATFGVWSHLAVAGRTDAGVHALDQVASVAVEGGPPTAAVPQVLNATLPPDVAVHGAVEVPDDFHARHSARARAYVYRVRTAPVRSAIDARRALHHPRPADRQVLAACARALPGRHDFRAFTPTETQHHDFTRTVHRAEWQTAADDELRFVIAADRFVRHQVRALVGTMLCLARREPLRTTFAELLAGAPRSAAGPTAPPWGLYLAGTRFQGEPDGCELVAFDQVGVATAPVPSRVT
jgi:tRNA pseudouridine38-40 synthase